MIKNVKAVQIWDKQRYSHLNEKDFKKCKLGIIVIAQLVGNAKMKNETKRVEKSKRVSPILKKIASKKQSMENATKKGLVFEKAIFQAQKV